MKTKNYQIMYESKKGDPDYPVIFKQLSIQIVKLDRKEKIMNLNGKSK